MVETDIETRYIGSYRITRALGEGAFGLVYEAYQPFLDRQVAVKTLHADLTSDPRVEQQFMHEARTIARLRHPNIVGVYEFGTVVTATKPYTYMVMEYLPGRTLQAVLKDGPIPVAEVVNITDQLAQALDYAHSQDVVHRDLKPANIMFTSQGQPVIVDFGLAKLMALGGFNRGETGILESTISGTPAYMSPEQAASRPAGPPSDQYSLGIIVYEMLCRRLPFEAADSPTLVLARLNGSPRPILEFAPQLPPQIEAILGRVLQDDPAARYPNARAFADALGEALLPDRFRPRVITIADPVQAAQLRSARQTLLGFMWGLVLVTIVVLIFCGAQFLRSFLNAEAPFIWDGIVASTPQHDGFRDVIGIWPDSPAEKSGLRVGDMISDDISFDRQVRDGDYKINGRPRSTYPANWQPQPGDVIERTAMRDGQPIQITYTLDLSTYQLWVLFTQVPSALLALISAVWLLRRWGAEPGIQLFVIVLLSGGFALVASGVGNVIVNIDTLALFIVLPLLIHFVLVFPEPIGYVAQHKRRLWWLYIPIGLGLIEFMMGRQMINSLDLNLIFYVGYSIAILVVMILKWGRRDLKHYPALWYLIGMVGIISLVAMVATIIFAFDDYTIVKTFWGGNGLNVYIAAYGLIIIGSTVAVLLGTIGYHRIQLAIGPSLLGSERVPA